MITQWNWNIRFGDPVLGLSMNSHYLIAGTAFGAVIIYDIQNKDLQILTEFSEEQVNSLSISQNNQIFFAVGDYYCAKLCSPFRSSRPKLIHYHQRIHSQNQCGRSLSFIHKNLCYLVSTSGEKVLALNFDSETTQVFRSIPENSIPLYAFEDKVLILHYLSNQTRRYSYFLLATGAVELVFHVPNKAGHITDMKMVSQGVAFLHDYKNLKIFTFPDGETSVFDNENTIVCYAIHEDEFI